MGQDGDTRQRYAALEAWATDRFGTAAVEYRWSAQDYQSTDGLPFIGRLHGRAERVYTATGFGKWGMTNGTAAGMILADLIQGRPNPWAETFDATRIAPNRVARGVPARNRGRRQALRG